jgi:hypothetical protein
MLAAKDPNLPLEVRIAAGARLWDVIKRANEALVPLKDELRNQAKLKRKIPGTVVIEGTGMTRAMVTLPKSILQVSKKTDIAALKRSITPMVFSALFEETCTYECHPNIVRRISGLKKEVRSSVLSAIEEIEGTPRVSLQFAGSNLVDLGVGPDPSKE